MKTVEGFPGNYFDLGRTRNAYVRSRILIAVQMVGVRMIRV